MRERPRIAMLLPSLAGGGAERVASLLAPRLAEAFSCTLFLLEDRVEYPLPPDLERVAFSPRLDGGAAGHAVRMPYFALRLAREARRRRIGLVFSLMEEANLVNLLAAPWSGHRTLVSQRTLPREQYARRGLWGRCIRQAARRLYPRADRIHVHAEALGGEVAADYGVAPAKVTALPNPIPYGELASPVEAEEGSQPGWPARPYLLHVGRLHLATKRQDGLLAVFARLAERFSETDLVFLGEGPDRARLEADVLRRSLGERVHLPGRRREVGAWMGGAVATVLCSRYEGWPNVLVEAMACGSPVVSMDCATGPGEILGGGRYGRLVADGDWEALEAALAALLESPTERARLAEAGRARAAMFDLDALAPAYIRLVERTLAASRDAPDA